MQELNENVKVKQTLDTVKEKVTGAVDHLDTMAAGVVDHLDTMAAGGLENLTAKLPALNTSTPELVETTKVFVLPIFKHSHSFIICNKGFQFGSLNTYKLFIMA